MEQKNYMVKGGGTLLLGDFLPKCGVDASIIVDLILYPNSKKYFKDRGYAFPDKTLCTTSNAIGDAKGTLINKYGYDPLMIDKEIDSILEEFFIEKLIRIPIADDIKVIENIGAEYQLNDEDVPIIYQFWKHGIKMVLVRDNAFEKTCQRLNIIVLDWPKKF